MSYIRYSYLKREKQLIIACSVEIVDRKELISEFQSMFEKLNIDSPVDVLLDVRDINLKASIEANKIYINYFLDEKLHACINKIAVLADSPNQVVQTMLFMDGINHLGTSIKIFSTEKSAGYWLNSRDANNQTLYVHRALSKLKLKKAS